MFYVGLKWLVSRFRQGQTGQGLSEYALILGLIAIVSIVALLFMGEQISGALSTVGQTLDDKT